VPVVVALDVDGVVLDAGRGDAWLDIVASDFGLSAEDLDPFFQQQWTHIAAGALAIETALGEAFTSIGKSVDVEAFLLRWFEETSTINEEIVTAAAAWSAAGARVVLATNQEHRRAAHLRTHLAAHLALDDLIYSADLGVGKPSPEFFALASQRLGEARVVFIDDAIRNVEAARAHGWTAIHYPHEQNWRDTVDALLV
jgi:putative hydrolase of the HAD superfamily